MRGNDAQQQIAIEAIRSIRQYSVTKDMVIGAGTINEPSKMQNAIAAGADFLVSADSADAMLNFWKTNHKTVPYYPTAYTTTEIKNAIDAGIQGIKLFPKNQILQADSYVKSLGNIYGARCCMLLSYDETHPQHITDLKYAIVAGIAAGWVIPAWAVEEKNWNVITQITTHVVEAIALQKTQQPSLLQAKIDAICALAKIESAIKDVPAESFSSSAKLLMALGIFTAGVAVGYKYDTLKSASPCLIL